MDILIKDMKMPKSCIECKFFIEDSWCLIRKGGPAVWFCKDKRSVNCPLISVPDHGRLIDADCCNGYFYEHMSDDMMIAAMNAINDMPTIIPADKEEQT